MFRCDVPDGAETPAWVDSSDNVLFDVPKLGCKLVWIPKDFKNYENHT